MDQNVRDRLAAAGFDVTMTDRIPTLPIKCDLRGQPLPIVDGEVALLVENEPVEIRLKPATELFAGSAVPPSFERGPTREYVPFFWMIEGTALEFC